MPAKRDETGVRNNGKSRGRPTKLTEETTERVAEAISIGATYKTAARYADISYDSLKDWRKIGEEIYNQHEAALAEWDATPPRDKKGLRKPKLSANDERYVNFFIAVEEAKHTLAVECLQTIYNAARGDAVWAERMLQYKFPEDFPRGGVGMNVGIGVGGAPAMAAGGEDKSQLTIHIQYINPDDTVRQITESDDNLVGKSAPALPADTEHQDE
ncbi:MAG: hypothetical protein KC496_03560 [Anaerolineae bacterium]|nr:hypothetical protein [Anaerolineae bacterium]